MATRERKQRIDKSSSLGRLLAQRTGNWLLASMDEYLEQSAEVRHDPGWFHPSSLANPCDAFLAFQYLGIAGKSKISARTRRIFDNGHARDRDVKRYLKESGLSLVKQNKDRYLEIPQLRIRGELDDIVFNKETNETYVFEFKTMNRDEWSLLRSPKPEHVIQVHPYMFAKGILQAQIVYECKNCQDWKTYVKRFDRKLWSGIESRLLGIMEMIKNKQVPWRTPMQYDSRCQFYHACAGFEFKE